MRLIVHWDAKINRFMEMKSARGEKEEAKKGGIIAGALKKVARIIMNSSS